MAKDIQHSKEFGIHTTLDSIKMDELMNHVQKVIASIEPHDSVERYKRLGVTVVLGKGQLLDTHLDKRGYIVTNKQLQTSIKNIYACGDVTRPYQFTHMASYQASIVIKNSLFHLGTKANYSAVPWTTYTKPEVAHVGYTEAMARKARVFKSTLLVPLNENDRAKAENDTRGFLKLIIGNGKKLIGATLVGEKAGEIMPVATLAIHQKLNPDAFLKFIIAYPTEAEIFQAASVQALRRSFKPWQAKLIKAVFFRHA